MTFSESIGWAVVDGDCLPGFPRIGLRTKSPAGQKSTTLGVCCDTERIARFFDFVSSPLRGAGEVLRTDRTANSKPTNDRSSDRAGADPEPAACIAACPVGSTAGTSACARGTAADTQACAAGTAASTP